MAVVGDFIGKIRDLGLERGGFRIEPRAPARTIVAGLVFGQTLTDLPSEVQTWKAGIFLLEFLDHAEALAIVLKPAVVLHQLVQNHLPFVSERGMAQVVRQRDGLGEVIIQLQGAGDVAGDGRDLHGVRQPGAQMIAGTIEKDLGLVFEPAERARVNDAITVPLVMRAPIGRLFRVFAPAGIGAELRVRREELPLQLFDFFASPRHRSNSK